MKFTELTNKSVAELNRLLSDTKLELQQLNFKVRAGQLQQVRKIRQAKRTVARILTALNQSNVHSHDRKN
ncbi:MAG: 50S ribosomal protein L29 [Candidatus Kerfeldbacteria bacterium]|nr:50S ribosomal protein L29 [Candidatus Kerfeldbacteria bacterium]